MRAGVSQICFGIVNLGIFAVPEMFAFLMESVAQDDILYLYSWELPGPVSHLDKTLSKPTKKSNINTN